MAFPVIQTGDTASGTQTSNATTWTVSYPTNLASGDLILGFFANDGNASFITSGFPAGWVAGGVAGAANGLSYAKKLSDGTETGTFSASLGANEQGSWRIFRITSWEGTLGTAFANAASSSSVVGVDTVTGSPSTTPDPPSLNPANWVTEDTLWFALCSVDTSRTISVYPLADNNTADVSGGAGGATLGICTTNSAVSSLDPSTFTISTSDDWIAGTVAVRPAATLPLVLSPGFVDFNDPGVL